MSKVHYPAAPRPSCHALVRDKGNVLLVRRGSPPYLGCWGLPGGAVELGETVAEALQREVREETGIRIEVGRFLDFIDAIHRDDAGDIRYHYVVHFFTARPTGGRLRSASDAEEALWAPEGDLDDYRLVPGAEKTLRRDGINI